VSVRGSIYGTTGDSGERWPHAPLAVPLPERRQLPDLPMTACLGGSGQVAAESQGAFRWR